MKKLTLKEIVHDFDSAINNFIKHQDKIKDIYLLNIPDDLGSMSDDTDKKGNGKVSYRISTLMKIEKDETEVTPATPIIVTVKHVFNDLASDTQFVFTCKIGNKFKQIKEGGFSYMPNIQDAFKRFISQTLTEYIGE